MVEARQYSPTPDTLPNQNPVDQALQIILDEFGLKNLSSKEKGIKSISACQTAYHVLSSRGFGTEELADKFGANPITVSNGLIRFYGRRKSDLGFRELTDRIDSKVDEIYPIKPVVKDPVAQQILELVQGESFIPRSAIRGTTRFAAVASPRFIAMHLLRHADLELKQIGLILGKRDHSTVIHGLSRVQRLMSLSPEFNERIKGLENEVDVIKERQSEIKQTIGISNLAQNNNL